MDTPALSNHRFGLSCKANKCSDAGTGNLGSPLVMPAKPALVECRLKLVQDELNLLHSDTVPTEHNM